MREPATEAYRALDDLKQDITELIRQRDSWIKRFQRAMGELAHAESERDYWQQVAWDHGSYAE